ncbi:MAG: enoyl-CoA hydratase/isomerase family protein [Syntrophomonadaceae bacterium]|nr:enoyl-CoA hydratase/isomerase family protein [Syntrophomonadaceae bacterium]MDD3022496.1 enoyl-CoA hydratase/isomerase family protein [Syntrophomonadaceae bacterium]
MDYQHILFTKESNIGIVTINRPEVKNALSMELLDEITDIFNKMEQDEEINAVVITGSDEAFAAGFDMNSVMALGKNKNQGLKTIEESFLGILKFPMPVIAAVSGPALAAGFDLMVMADIRVMSETAKLGQPEIRWALTPLSDPLWKIIGMGRAKELTMTGRIYGAEEAKDMGLANFVYPVESYLKEAKKLAHKIAAFERNALKANKEQTNRVPGMEVHAAVRTQLWTFRSFVGSEEMIERMSAFLDSNKQK